MGTLNGGGLGFPMENLTLCYWRPATSLPELKPSAQHPSSPIRREGARKDTAFSEVDLLLGLGRAGHDAVRGTSPFDAILALPWPR